jgi:integral membrane protein (TIGR01906 family)
VAGDRSAVRAVAGAAPGTRAAALRAVAIALVVLIAAVVPPVLVVNAFRVLATDSFVRFELGRIPPDLYGFSDDQRQALALTGLRSIRPGSAGIALLERATLPDGSPAFDHRELTHMHDVRRLFGAALRLQLVVLVVVAVLGLVLARTRLRTAVPTGLLAGALATLAIAVLAVPVILLGFDGFFTRFHEVFFEGDSWRFSTADTLIRLYPERFWEDVSQLAAAIVVGQALVLAPLAWWWRRAAGRQSA